MACGSAAAPMRGRARRAGSAGSVAGLARRCRMARPVRIECHTDPAAGGGPGLAITARFARAAVAPGYPFRGTGLAVGDRACRDTGGGARPRTPGLDRAAGRHAGGDGGGQLWVPVRQGQPAAGHRLQPDRAQARRGTLRPACLRSPPLQLRRHCARPASAGNLVCPGQAAQHRRGRHGAPLVERLDVRISDAPARHAVLRPHVAGADLRVGRARPDRVRRQTRHPLGHVRKRV
ncbi:hypothetical protein D3C87_1390280 [compost metagenome]